MSHVLLLKCCAYPFFYNVFPLFAQVFVHSLLYSTSYGLQMHFSKNENISLLVSCFLFFFEGNLIIVGQPVSDSELHTSA